MITKDLKYYMGLDYTIELHRDEEGDWIASVKELERCSAHGVTQSEALKHLEGMKELWLSSALKSGRNISMPEKEEDLPSGKWLQRTPRSLHRKLAIIAKKEQVSLNQLVTYLLAEAVGKKALGTGGVISDLDASHIGHVDQTGRYQIRLHALTPSNPYYTVEPISETFAIRLDQDFLEVLSGSLGTLHKSTMRKEEPTHGATEKSFGYAVQ